MKYLRDIMQMIENEKTWASQSDIWDRNRYSSAYNSKQVLGLLSILSLPCILFIVSPLSWNLKMPLLLLSGYSALVIFTLYKQYDLKRSVMTYNKSKAELLDLCFKLASERGAKLQIEPRIITDSYSFLFARDCQLELKGLLIESGEQRAFFSARIPLSTYLDSTFSVEYPEKIALWFDEKTLKHLEQTAVPPPTLAPSDGPAIRPLIGDAIKTERAVHIWTKLGSEFDCRILKQTASSFHAYCKQSEKLTWFDFDEIDRAALTDEDVSLPPGISLRLNY